MFLGGFMRVVFFVVAFTLFFGSPLLMAEEPQTKTSLAVSPLKEIERTVDELITVIEGTSSVSAPIRRDKLRIVINRLFDFEEMAKRSLGAHWKEISTEEQNEFVHVFSDLLARTYLTKIETLKRGMVRFDSERVESPRALVKTFIENNGDKFPLDYKLLDRSGSWKVYDVVIENIGLVANYRNEFAGVIRKETFAGLLKKLKEK
jgi:phospholipid transport system substrate-binding protein